MNKVCKNCNIKFQITPDDQAFYVKIDVPTPTLCPDCRYQRRLANRNEWNFFKRNCTLCGKSMVSIYNPDYPGPVYCQPCFWSDNWDTLDYGRDFDFSRPFFEQFKEHRFAVPRIALANSKSVNSEYTNQSSENRNCYMLVATSWNEYCLYSNWLQHCRECVDNWNLDHCELMYEAVFADNSYRCAFVDDAGSCHDVYFCDDVVGCSNCFGCVSLRQKSYCWFNEQLSKEEYNKRFAAVVWSPEGIEKNKAKLYELRLTRPVAHFHGDFNLNTVGDYIDHNKNTHYAFNAGKNENAKYLQDAWEAKDSMDLTETLDNTFDYECEGTGWGRNNISVSKKWYGSNDYYSELMFHSDNMFGCVSMSKKKYCIFNKQYSPEEYKKLKEKIVAHMKSTGEWGEFFPMSISPFPYEDSVAQDYFPRDINRKKTPYTGADAIRCTNTACAGVGAFRLHPTEIEFYKKMRLPAPIKCFPCRLKERLARRTPRKLWKRKCMKCEKELETSYAPDRPEIVYCEQCYNAQL